MDANGIDSDSGEQLSSAGFRLGGDIVEGTPPDLHVDILAFKAAA